MMYMLRITVRSYYTNRGHPLLGTICVARAYKTYDQYRQYDCMNRPVASSICTRLRVLWAGREIVGC